ncbi:alpha beta-hydrolase [Imleria badia]|nr:alpha beta-hydrolase [Imleria badia]
MSPRTSAIPYTPTSPGWTSVHPRPLRPIRPHPSLDSVETPPLPSPPRPPVFHTTTHGVYRLTTHLVPAAYPRLAPDIPLPEIPAYTPGGSPAKRRDKMDVLVKQIIQTQNAYHEDRLGQTPSETLLWNCVNRYVRTSSPTKTTAGAGVTLFLAHANGFHKETWETMLRGLLDAPAGEMVDEVWAWEAVQHGDAAIVNAANLSGIYDWLDNTQDIAHFLVHYLPEDVEATVLPTRLPRLPASMTNAREERGYRTRKLVVVGHSFGGCTSLRVAFDSPKLFSAFVLVDPVILRPRTYRPGFLYERVLGAFTRRDRWSSREEALQLFQKSPFFGAWHPDVLRLYVDHALIDDAEGGVRLKMSGLQEGISFTNQVPSFETWELLERLDKGITLRWVVPEQTPASISTKEMTDERVWRRPADSTNVMFHFAGHLVVQEAPVELAHDISEFLVRKYGSAKPRL